MRFSTFRTSSRRLAGTFGPTWLVSGVVTRQGQQRNPSSKHVIKHKQQSAIVLQERSERPPFNKHLPSRKTVRQQGRIVVCKPWNLIDDRVPMVNVFRRNYQMVHNPAVSTSLPTLRKIARSALFEGRGITVVPVAVLSGHCDFRLVWAFCSSNLRNVYLIWEPNHC